MIMGTGWYSGRLTAECRTLCGLPRSVGMREELAVLAPAPSIFCVSPARPFFGRLARKVDRKRPFSFPRPTPPAFWTRAAACYAVHHHNHLPADMRSRVAGVNHVLDTVQSPVPCRQRLRLRPR